MLILFSRKHKDDAPEEENFNEKKSTDNSLPKWDSEFLKVDQGTLFGMELNLEALKTLVLNFKTLILI